MFRDRDKWRVRWQEGEKTRSRTFESKNDAALFEAQLKSGVKRVATLEEEATTFAQFAERWFRDYAQVEKSETTWQNDLTAIRIHLNPVLGELKLHQIRKANGFELRSSLKSKSLTPKTINNVFGLAKKMLSFAVDIELIKENPFSLIKPLKTPEPKFSFWTSADSEKFLERCRTHNPEFHTLVLVALRCGLRLGELGALTRKDLDFDRNLIQVGATYSRTLKKHLDRTKNYEVEFVPMTPQVREALLTKKLMKPDQLIFETQLCKQARIRLRRYAAKFQVPVITFHDLRHSFASQLAIEGVDRYRIQKLLRHKSPDMTERYSHLRPDDLIGSTDILEKPSAKRPQEPKNSLHNLG